MLLIFFIVTVLMVFAGLTSGYIVSQGDTFWVAITMPTAFQLSTISILVSSGFLFLAMRSAKKSNQQLVKISLGLAMVCGLAFGFFQVKGWGQLFDKGATVSDWIINHKGQYGRHYKFYHQEKEITYDNGRFYWRSDEVSPELKEEMVNLCVQLEEGAKTRKGAYKLDGYGENLILRYHGEVVTYLDDTLRLGGNRLDELATDELRYFAESIKSGRGDFMMIGEYGVDFWIYYKGAKIEYEHRQFFWKGKPLSPKQLNDLQEQKNTASSYIYAFTFIHLLHWIGGAIALIVMFFRGIQSKYTASDTLGLRLGSIYWHFLGILWIYLYLFLIYIH